MTSAPPGSVLLVDDDDAVRAAMMQSFELAGLPVRAFATAIEALPMIDAGFKGVIVSDIRMPELDGRQLHQRVRALDATIPFIFITGHGDISMAVAALREGVDDFIPKPFASAHLIASVQRSLDQRRLTLDSRTLQLMVAEHPASNTVLVGETRAIVELRENISRLASADVAVLIQGEEGVGKSVVASLLHKQTRRGRLFVKVSCQGLSDDHASQILFGDAGLMRGKSLCAGRAVQAHRGTLFVDDIDRLGIAVQSRLTHLMEEHEITSDYADQPTYVDARLIAGTKSDLALKVGNGRFSSRLYHALQATRLYIPPLRDRREDIPLLFTYYVNETAAQLGCEPPVMTEAIRRHLCDHDWPGNLNELKSFATSWVVGLGAANRELDEHPAVPLHVRVDRFEAAAIRGVLSDAAGSAAKTISRLGIPRKTFYDKLHRHGINIKDFRK